MDDNDFLITNFNDMDFEEIAPEDIDISIPNADSINPIKAYLAEISKIPFLDSTEEMELAKRSAEGNEEAKMQLVNANLRLVVHIVKRYIGQGMDLVDLISEGNKGLLDAADKYDYKSGIKFSTYATSRIKCWVANSLPIVERRFKVPYKLAPKIVSGQYEGEYEVGLRMMDEASEILLDKGDNVEQVREKIERAMEILTERERIVLRMKFGLDDGYKKSAAEIATQVGVTKERVRQIGARALRKIRKYIDSQI